MIKKVEKKDYGRLALTVIVFLAIGLMTIFLATGILDNNENSSDETNDDDFFDLPVEDKEVIFFEDPKSVVLGAKKISITDPWLITKAQKTLSDKFFECESSTQASSCIVYYISNSEVEFILSIGGAYLYKGGFIGEVITKKTQFLEGDYNLVLEQYNTVNINDTSIESPDDFYRQIHICSEDNVCLSSGILSLNQQENRNQSKLFIDLIGSLQILK